MFLNEDIYEDDDIFEVEIPNMYNVEIDASEIDSEIPEAGPEIGISTIIMNSISSTYSMIEDYNSLSIALTDIGNENAALAVADIIAKEHSTIGVLQDILKEISPNADSIDDIVNESLNEDLNTLETPKEILVFTEMSIDDFKNLDLNNRYKLLKNAYQKYIEDYKEIKKSIDPLDVKDNDYEYQRNFYKKYINFAKKCKEYLENRDSISGYGKFDIFKVKIKDMCEAVDYNFPYGWKNI